METVFHPLSWVPLLRHVTPRTRFINLSAEYVSWLCTGSARITTDTQTIVEWHDGTQTQEKEEETRMTKEMRVLEGEINVAIKELNGCVSPKLDTRAPVDGTWANLHRSTRCETGQDVVTLLQASERALHAVAGGATLALRQWADLDERMELRVFVRDGKVVGICQRREDVALEYAEDEMDGLVRKIVSLYENVVRDRFQARKRFAMDVYVGGGKVWVMDFAEWGVCKALLFSWDELDEAKWMSIGRAQFRSAVRQGIRPGPEMFYGLPMELRDGGAMGDLIEAAQRLTQAQGPDMEDENSEDEGGLA